MRYAIPAIALALAILPGWVAADGDTPYLATIAIERAAGSVGTTGDALTATLHVNDPRFAAATLSNVDGLEITAHDAATVSIRTTARPTVRAAPGDTHRASTWVIDFEEADIQALVGQIAAATADDTSPEELERFVFEHIVNKSYSRSFDLASRVAATGEGDCTEHAVLLAALARAHDYPARVVFGNIVLDLDEGLFAFGHAWTEIHDGASWSLYDATMVDDAVSRARARYIPLGSLTDEGPGYFFSMLETLTSMPTRISEVAGL